MNMYLYISTYIHTYIHLHMYMYMYMCIYVCIYMYKLGCDGDVYELELKIALLLDSVTPNPEP